MARTTKSLLNWDDDLWSGVAFTTGVPIASTTAAGSTVTAGRPRAVVAAAPTAASTTIAPVPAASTVAAAGSGASGSVVSAASIAASTVVHKTPKLLDPAKQPKFVKNLPIPAVIDATKGGTFVVNIGETKQWLGLVGPDGTHLKTTVWGYGQAGKAITYPGPTFVAERGHPIQVIWQNHLPLTGQFLPVDTSIMHAVTTQRGAVPISTHLHGGHTAASSDGEPDAWYTRNFKETGPGFVSPVDTYNNDQPSATLWYHDHALGYTHYNVYAGLAGFYLLRDANEDNLVATGVLPGRKYEAGAAIQDRAFTSDGQLYLPAFANDPIPGTKDPVTGVYQTVQDMLGPDFTGTYPSVTPEFFGDFILVNGMAWPKFDADPGAYRFHLLNGSDSRFFVLQPDNPWVKVTLVGSDGGLLPHAITIMDGDGVQEAGEQLVLAPGDRADVVFDFSAPQLRGHSMTLLNYGPAYEPFKGMNPDGSLAGGVVVANPATDPIGQVMRFDVGAKDRVVNTATVTDGTVLDASYTPLLESDAAHTRKVGLFEGRDQFGRVTPTLGVAENTTDIDGNAVPFGPLSFDAPATETPTAGTTEVWDIFNLTADAHPIHLHLTQFQVLARHEISFIDANDDGVPDNVRGSADITAGSNALTDDVVEGAALPLSAMDQGWQDTITLAPNQSISIIAPFDMAGDYVWHCHILSHEEHDMMRPLTVLPAQS